MATYQVYKELTLPATLTPNSIYLVAPAATPDLMEIYVTGTSASVVKRVINQADVQAMITTSIAGANELYVVNDIAERDALNVPTPMTVSKFVFVANATADTTVASGGATYIWNQLTQVWIKISESESMDLILQWSNIQNKPTSTVAAIDDAVSKAHVHANDAVVQQLGQDVGGNLTYNGQTVMSWANTGW
jgi:hypothetical protein